MCAGPQTEGESLMNPILRIILLGVAWLSFGLGIIGIFIPVLPTTPLILLATFLCAKCSPRCHRMITGSKVYKCYVVPFKEAGGMPIKAKVRMLAISYTVLGISAVLVRKPVVWIILGCVALFLLYLAFVHIPTVDEAVVKNTLNENEEASCEG